MMKLFEWVKFLEHIDIKQRYKNHQNLYITIKLKSKEYT